MRVTNPARTPEKPRKSEAWAPSGSRSGQNSMSMPAISASTATMVMGAIFGSGGGPGHGAGGVDSGVEARDDARERLIVRFAARLALHGGLALRGLQRRRLGLHGDRLRRLRGRGVLLRHRGQLCEVVLCRREV